MRVVALDTETAGFKKPLTPIELGALWLEGPTPKHSMVMTDFESRYRINQPLEYGAMATHNILPGDLAGCPEWDAKAFGLKLRDATYLVGHNIDYDWEVIGSPEILRIDTLALARYWYPNLDSHKLGAMMYWVFGPTPATREMLKGAHSAIADITNTVALLTAMVAANSRTDLNWHELHALSEIGRVPYRMTFGKYGPKDGNQGKRIRDIKLEDPGYVRWLRGNCSDDKYLMKALDNPR